MVNIGVLALQGSFREHIDALCRLNGINPIAVRTIDELNASKALIIPGGESTVMGKLLRNFGLFEPLKLKIENGFPVWGTCAGLILLAKEIDGASPYFSAIDITVQRNAYGGQLDSFTRRISVPDVSPEPFDAVFIRAPRIERSGKKVKVLSKSGGRTVAARQGNVLVTAFHPELTGDLSFHRYFTHFV